MAPCWPQTGRRQRGGLALVGGGSPSGGRVVEDLSVVGRGDRGGGYVPRVPGGETWM
jgi:hypothetical protein